MGEDAVASSLFADSAAAEDCGDAAAGCSAGAVFAAPAAGDSLMASTGLCERSSVIGLRSQALGKWSAEERSCRKALQAP